ncbi:MAG: peptidase M1 [Flavobacteriaceae bacterium]|nr:MAG: peptidase M1 [Flavobacteriaceae bacterium]
MIQNRKHMKKSYSFLLGLIFLSQVTFGQNHDLGYTEIHPNSLVHTKLDLSFDIPNQEIFGVANLTVKPNQKPTDQLVLDAKSMLIHQVLVNQKKSKFSYKNDLLTIDLGQTFQADTPYQVEIKYTAQPSKIKGTEGEAITEARGMYFIDPKEEDPDKPTQIWTQGEPESNSAWFPTLDSPNQKTTQEISIEVPSKFVTLSNGVLVSQKNNPNGTRTDYWKHDQPHAPYLFFVGAGEFDITKDKYKDIPVDYYTEPKYTSTARETYGMTPEMIGFFSKIYGIEYPWKKYSQITVRDFVSGAMENTTAVVHAEGANQTKRSLIDENSWEDIIAHELTHHWFGDLVTTENWSNLTVNESFANYSEYLWREYKYGKDHAEAHRIEDIEGYMRDPENTSKNLVRTSYKDIRDVFDGVTYNKGGYILHMLRGILGDEHFFGGLKLYLSKYSYQTGNAQKLQSALEEVSKRDLDWFFNQWYYGSGHPEIVANYKYNPTTKKLEIDLVQTQKGQTFEFPLTIDYLVQGKTRQTSVWVKSTKSQRIEVPIELAPELVILNANQDLLCTLEDKSKSLNGYILQYKNSKEYLSRKIAIEQIALAQNMTADAEQTMFLALDDPYYGLRELAIEKLDIAGAENKAKLIAKLVEIAKNDPKTLVQKQALKQLASLENAKDYLSLFELKSKSESNAVSGEALMTLLKLAPEKTTTLVKNINLDEVDGDLKYSLMGIFSQEKNPEHILFVAKNLDDLLIETYEDQSLMDTYVQSVRWIMSSGNLQALDKTLEGFKTLNQRYGKYESFKQNLVGIVDQCISLAKDARQSKEKEFVLKIQNTLNEIK